jgi:hypothetical protein
MKTNWQDPGSGEINSPAISGLQEAVGKIEDAIGLQTVAEVGVPLTEVYIEADDRYRIYQAAVGKRNWVADPAPVIKKNGVAIATGFTIDYGGGAIILDAAALGTDVFIADFTRTNDVHSITPASIGAESKADADAHKAESAILTPQAGSTANAIILNFTAEPYKKGSFKATADNTGNMTINGLPFLKLDGSQIPAGGVKSGKVYDFYYDNGSGGRFFVLPKASGTAVASDVRLGKTFSNDSDSDIVGALDLTNLTPENIRKDVTIGGVTGNKLEFGSGDWIDQNRIGKTTAPPLLWQSNYSSNPSYAGMTVLGDSLYSVQENGNVIAKFDAITGVRSGTANATYLFKGICSDSTRNKIYALDAQELICYNPDLTVAWTINIYAIKSAYMQFQGLTQDSSFLYVVDTTGYIYKIHKDTQAVSTSNSFATSYLTITANDVALYIANTSSSYWAKQIDKNTLAQISSFTVQRPNGGICVTNANELYVGYNDSSGQYVFIYNSVGTIIGQSDVLFTYCRNVKIMNGFVYVTTGYGTQSSSVTKLKRDNNSLKRQWTYISQTTGAACESALIHLPDGRDCIAVGGGYIEVANPYVQLT